MTRTKKPADFQRQAVYEWERLTVERWAWTQTMESVEYARGFADQILLDHGLTWLPAKEWRPELATFAAKRDHLVWWKRGSGKNGVGDAGGICYYERVDAKTGIPKRMEIRTDNRTWVLLHELAHLIVIQTLGKHKASVHGSAFVRMAIDLYARHLNCLSAHTPTDARAELEASARAAGLAFDTSTCRALVQSDAGRAARPSAAADPKPKAKRAPKKPVQPKKAKAPRNPKAPKPKKEPKAPKEKGGPRAAPVASTCEEKPGAIVRRIFDANSALGFAEIVRLCAAEGVNPNTARGTLVRLKREQGK